jgi:5-methylcytosine-specific restriction protein B
LQDVFVACKAKHPKDYESPMPFGHGIFADVLNEKPDLFWLWNERLKHMDEFSIKAQ